MDGQAQPLSGPASSALDSVLGSLLSSAGQGDEAAFSRLYDLAASRVFGLVRRVVRDPDNAEHVSGEVFVEVWHTAARYRSGSGALAWVLAVAHRRAVAHVRSTRHPLTPSRPLAAATAEASRHEALTLSYFDAYAVTDVARALGVSVDVAHQHLRAALATLQPGPAAA
ncbi:sigma factor [Terracoccus sp. 273MFTsu3.1]|uniref:sigma factor n=1 Tax=Terracoccus sp. 273MFTsu3.1 TaxID=1172188 RepID=UPI00037CAA91|nr:sigma factor [Terracoccus sp. 273MFTsu3.1]